MARDGGGAARWGLPAARGRVTHLLMHRHPAATGLVACLLALAMHVLMPPGWMPAAAGLVPCSALAAADGLDRPDGGPASDGCDFAWAAAPLLAAGDGGAPWLQRLPPLAATAAALPVLQVARAWPRPPGQGPPLA
jgi:hypothetical protein